MTLNEPYAGQAFLKRALAMDANNAVAKLTHRKLKDKYKLYNQEQKKHMAAAFAKA